MKKFWKKYKIVIIVAVSVLAFVALSVLSEGSRKVESGLEDFKANFTNDEYSIAVIGLTYCEHCHNFSPIIRKISKANNLPLYWFDIDALSNEDSSYLYDLFGEYGYEGASPYIAVINKGNIIANHTGEMDEEATIEFLKESGVIK